MIYKLKTFFAVTFTLFLLGISAQACICVRDDLEVKGFRGEVFDIYGVETPTKETVKNATVKLLKETKHGKKVIVAVSTDENGRFDVKKIKSGNYILEVSFPAFVTISTRIKILSSSDEQKDEVLVRLDVASSTGCCFGEAKVQKTA